MKNTGAKSPEFYFNVDVGKVTIGRAALEASIEAGEDPRDLKPLAELLMDPSIELRTDNWQDRPVPEEAEPPAQSKEELSTYGDWLNGVVKAREPGAVLLERHLDRAHELGLGRKATYIVKRFNNRLWEYRESFGETSGIHMNRFSSWEPKDYVRYAKMVAKGIKRKPTLEDFDRWKDRGWGPSGNVIMQRFPGGIRTLNDRIGYPDISSWQKEDYIRYGVKVLRANPDARLTARQLDHLSKAKRGPSAKQVSLEFTYHLDFVHQVRAEYEKWRKEIGDTLEELKNEAARHPFLETLFDRYRGDDERIIRACSQYLVGKTLLGEAEEDFAKSLAEYKHGDTFAARIANVSKSVTIAEVEVKASALGFFDFIWPFDENLQHLRLPTGSGDKPAVYRPLSAVIDRGTYIDLSTGKLVEAGSGHENGQADDTNIEHGVSLGTILLAPKGTFYPPVPESRPSDTDMEEMIETGRWMLSHISIGRDFSSRRLIENANRVGLITNDVNIRKLFGSLANFINLCRFEELGAEKWTRADYIQYGAAIAQHTAAKPTFDDFEKWAKLGFGPDLQTISEYFGDTETYFAAIGFPDTSNWQKPDFISWGVSKLVTIEGNKIDVAFLENQATDGRGPTITQIEQAFGSTKSFIAKIRREYRQLRQQQDTELAERLGHIRDQVTRNIIPEHLPVSIADDHTRVQACAKYELLLALGVEDTTHALAEISRVSPRNFIRSIQRYTDQSPREVEETAKQIGVYYIIWPEERFSPAAIAA